MFSTEQIMFLKKVTFTKRVNIQYRKQIFSKNLKHVSVPGLASRNPETTTRTKKWQGRFFKKEKMLKELTLPKATCRTGKNCADNNFILANLEVIKMLKT